MSKMADFFDRFASEWANERLDEERVLPLLRRLNIKEGGHVLDIGCGCGIITPYLQKMSKAKVTAIDASPRMIEEAKKKGLEDCYFLNADFYEMDGEFDYIVCYNAYPHFVDTNRFKEKAFSLLMDGGKLYVLHSLGREKLNAHHQGMDKDLYRDLLPVKEEADQYKDRFNIIDDFEDENSYGFILQKNR